MGPPCRNPPKSTSSMDSLSQTPQRTPDRELEPSSPTTASLGMSPASRYNYNLKVLRRRDPSIISIFDQFSHVCIYHHDGQQWSKHGYEGSMFLFERNAYPPYGFYILNRVGMDDYISRLYPEDEIFHQGSILIMRSFPDFLARRLASIESSSGQTPDKFSDIYAIPNIEDLSTKQKGRFFNIGLWMQPTESRESIAKVMLRLHSYVKQNLPYPQEFRYGPGKPPPPHRLRAVPRSPSISSGDISASSGDLSAVEKLFAKITPYPQPSAPAAPVTMNTLFASAMENSTPASPSTNAGTTGISLLDTIFASADPSRTGTLSPQNGPAPSSPVSSSLKPQASLPPIYSPRPSSSAAPPQILNQDVISGLLGFPPTRTTSAASTTYSIGAVSHPSSREGDDEDNSESDISPGDRRDESGHLDNGLSGAGVVFDNMNLESSPERQRPSGSAAARIAGSELLSTLGFSTGKQESRGKINGDVTPRGPLTRPSVPHRLQSTVIEATSSISTVRGTPEPVVAPSSISSTVSVPTPAAGRKPRPNRTLVPFASDSELWPYTQGPVQENFPTDPDEDGDDGDIVELNFEETSVLSDPEAFKKALQRKKSGLKTTEVSVNGHRNVNGVSGEKEKGKRNRKNKKERREIEESWDIPPPSFVDPVASTSFNMLPVGPPASPSPCASPELPNTSLNMPSTSTSGLEMMSTPTMTAKAILGNAGKQVNGTSIVPVPSAQKYTRKTKGVSSNGVPPMKKTQQNGGLDAECVRESIVATVEAQSKLAGRMEKNEFIREVMALIHTDKAFVDTLWQQYMARLA